MDTEEKPTEEQIKDEIKSVEYALEQVLEEKCDRGWICREVKDSMIRRIYDRVID
jgi:hypothetical protein